MKAVFRPSSLRGKITPPSSKSYAHRLLIAGALSDRDCVIGNIDFNNDILETIGVLRKLGKEVVIRDNSVILKGMFRQQDSIDLSILESGSTLRFFIPIAMVYSSRIIIHSSPRLIARGIEVYTDAFKGRGVNVKIGETEIEISGRLTSGDYTIPGNISSQYVTGLLFGLSLLSKPSRLSVLKPIESEDYINITLDVLKQAKVRINSNDYVYDVPPSAYHLYKADVEADYSNAAFIDALNTFSGPISVKGLNYQSKQGDRIYPKLFNEIHTGYCEINISNCIDLGPVLFAMAALNRGAKFNGTHRLAIKESDRAAAMKEELSKLGADIEIHEDWAVVHPAKLHAPDRELDSHNDHRIAMALAVVCLKYGGTVNNIECIRKSYPEFLTDIEKLGGEVLTHDN